ncbi:MAG: ABC transporter ATP-binding protein [Proteobacteria bacterium]|nr:ABC transporter ATP-binding protein [Desulfocapsa sp.]MBU3944461.1 ABC transporter ATP-binding protein [Pseudomonadota bacterium]MCG2744721.1 ABC transporter ATP-binding protein [Desulfobacteraceae bacterium]MBU3984705.1 ABC transporter ATP-binding protein [Pseudomonadota bacterium]MBU4029692.1 ABC transporter ATP-binding protein [Pseudomonadota bacterium]
MIHLQHIERIFLVGDEEVHALSDVSMTAADGEYIAIMGPSGSGKSSLLNIIGLLDRPDSGSYELDGITVSEVDEQQQAEIRRHKIGFVFQFFHLVPRLTAFDNIALPLMLSGMKQEERQVRVTAALAAFGLSNRAGHRPDQLSGGQRQRVAIARATIMQPSVILADEPTGNLDRSSGIEVAEILEELNHQGITLIMVTHDPDLGRRARRQILMVDGRIEHDK